MQGTEQKAGRKGLARLRAGLWVAAGVSVLIALAVIYDRGHPPGDPASQYASAFGGPFVLTAPDGSSVTDKTLAGKPYAIFFGFTRCPDVCPTSLARMARLRKQLGPDGAKFNIVFVSVDPGHDKPADIGSYVALFGTPIINQPQVAILAVGYIEKKPAVVETPEGDTIAIRHKMYLSLSYDHRIVDGALAGAFLRSIADELENWNA